MYVEDTLPCMFQSFAVHFALDLRDWLHRPRSSYHWLIHEQSLRREAAKSCFQPHLTLRLASRFVFVGHLDVTQILRIRIMLRLSYPRKNADFQYIEFMSLNCLNNKIVTVRWGICARTQNFKICLCKTGHVTVWMIPPPAICLATSGSNILLEMVLRAVPDHACEALSFRIGVLDLECILLTWILMGFTWDIGSVQKFLRSWSRGRKEYGVIAVNVAIRS